MAGGATGTRGTVQCCTALGAQTCSQLALSPHQAAASAMQTRQFFFRLEKFCPVLDQSVESCHESEGRVEGREQGELITTGSLHR